MERLKHYDAFKDFDIKEAIKNNSEVLKELSDYTLNGEKDKKNCPICGSIITFYPAISRLDNKTEICSDCGVCEAITIYKMSLENKNTNSKQD